MLRTGISKLRVLFERHQRSICIKLSIVLLVSFILCSACFFAENRYCNGIEREKEQDVHNTQKLIQVNWNEPKAETKSVPRSFSSRLDTNAINDEGSGYMETKEIHIDLEGANRFKDVFKRGSELKPDDELATDNEEEDIDETAVLDILTECAKLESCRKFLDASGMSIKNTKETIDAKEEASDGRKTEELVTITESGGLKDLNKVATDIIDDGRVRFETVNECEILGNCAQPNKDINQQPKLIPPQTYLTHTTTVKTTTKLPDPAVNLEYVSKDNFLEKLEKSLNENSNKNTFITIKETTEDHLPITWESDEQYFPNVYELELDEEEESREDVSDEEIIVTDYDNGDFIEVKAVPAPDTKDVNLPSLIDSLFGRMSSIFTPITSRQKPTPVPPSASIFASIGSRQQPVLSPSAASIFAPIVNRPQRMSTGAATKLHPAAHHLSNFKESLLKTDHLKLESTLGKPIWKQQLMKGILDDWGTKPLLAPKTSASSPPVVTDWYYNMLHSLLQKKNA